MDANFTACAPNWSSRSHFFSFGLVEADGTLLDCETHEPTFIGLNYTAYVLGILLLCICLWRLLHSRPIVLFHWGNLGPAHEKRRLIQGVLFNTTLEMICTVALQSSSLFWNQLLHASTAMTVILLIYYVAICLDSFLYLRITVSTALLGVRALDGPSQNKKTNLLNAVSAALHVIVFLLLVIGIVGVRAAREPQLQLLFGRLFLSATAISTTLLFALAFLHLTIIINALREHSKTAKAHGLSGKQFNDVITRVRSLSNLSSLLFTFSDDVAYPAFQGAIGCGNSGSLRRLHHRSSLHTTNSYLYVACDQYLGGLTRSRRLFHSPHRYSRWSVCYLRYFHCWRNAFKRSSFHWYRFDIDPIRGARGGVLIAQLGNGRVDLRRRCCGKPEFNNGET